jgi:negative regulator of flagellin synthesis FlgM
MAPSRFFRERRPKGEELIKEKRRSTDKELRGRRSPVQGRGDDLEGKRGRHYSEDKEIIMKITDVQGLEVEQLQAKQTEKVGKTQGQQVQEKTGGESDVIQLSPQSRLMQRASEVIYQAPEVRSEKVAAVQDSVDQGTYEVDSQKVANKLITEMITEK